MVKHGSTTTKSTTVADCSRIERINKTEYLKEVVVSDSLPQNKKQEKCSKLKTFSIVPMLSEVIKRLDKGGSLSEIFSY